MCSTLNKKYPRYIKYKYLELRFKLICLMIIKSYNTMASGKKFF